MIAHIQAGVWQHCILNMCSTYVLKYVLVYVRIYSIILCLYIHA